MIASLAKRTLWDSGGYALVARARPWPGVAVLAYHGVRGDDEPGDELHVRATTLEEHLRVIRALGTPISLDDWRRARRGESVLPSGAVLLTFDDGYRSVPQRALPLLERYDVPATIFVCTGPSQRGELLWYDALARAGRAHEIELAKELSYDDWRALAQSCAVAAAPHDPQAVMRPDEIARLATHPLIEIGAHTVDHPILARAGVGVQRQQMAACVTDLQEWTARPVRALAYPNGRPQQDFTDETMAIARELSIDVAFSTAHRFATSGDTVHRLPRFTMLDTMTAPRLAHYLTVSWPRTD